MRQKIPVWVAVVIIVVVAAVAIFVLWSRTGVQKVQERPEESPAAMMQKYGAPGSVPRGAPSQR